MCLRVFLQSSLRIALVLLIGIALLQVPFVSIFVNAMGQSVTFAYYAAVNGSVHIV